MCGYVFKNRILCLYDFAFIVSFRDNDNRLIGYYSPNICERGKRRKVWKFLHN